MREEEEEAKSIFSDSVLSIILVKNLSFAPEECKYSPCIKYMLESCVFLFLASCLMFFVCICWMSPLLQQQASALQISNILILMILDFATSLELNSYLLQLQQHLLTKSKKLKAAWSTMNELYLPAHTIFFLLFAFYLKNIKIIILFYFFI